MTVTDVQAPAAEAIRELLLFIGEDPERDGLRDTPRRVLDSFLELTAGYSRDPAKVLCVRFEQTEPAYGGIVAAVDVPFTSMCEHHLMPFHGTASVAYIPEEGGPLVGLSKLARLIDIYALRLQLQERMTAEIVNALDTYLRPLAAACVVRAEHSCMARRGVKKPTSAMVTSELRGRFLHDGRARDELFLILAGQR
jgi:GTP cyclohydrolase I